MVRRVYRAGARDDSDLHQIARRSRDEPGRFNTSKCGALYVSCDEETALLELRRTTEEVGKALTDAHPCAILALDVTIANIWDLAAPDVLRDHGLSRADVVSDDPTACQRAAERALDAGVEAIVWESAACNGGLSMAIFMERLRPDSSVSLVGAKDVSRERLEKLDQEAARR